MGEKRYLASDVGIQTADGFHALFGRGDRLPLKTKVTLRTDEDDQSAIEFTILQRLGPAWSAAFRQARVDGLPPKPRGKVKIKLHVAIDAEGGLVARLSAPGKKGTTEIARGRTETASREGLDRAARPSDGIGLQERGLLPAGVVDTPEAPLTHECTSCGEAIEFRAISTLSPATDGLTCDACGNVLLIPPLDNMASSFFRNVPGGRLGLALVPASIEAERIAAHGRALERLEAALRPCPCGGRFGFMNPSRCPACSEPFVDHAGDLLFRMRQSHLPLVRGAEVLSPTGADLWTAEHLAPYEADLRLGPLEQKGERLLLPIRFRNRGGWLVIPIQYALVLHGPDSGTSPAFRPIATDEPGVGTPEAWQARQSEEDEAFADEVERDLGFRPLQGRVEPDEEVEGKAVFPVKGKVEGPLMLAVARAIELPLA